MVIGGLLLLYLGIKKELNQPCWYNGQGTILVNFKVQRVPRPNRRNVTQHGVPGPFSSVPGIETELFPSLIFIRIGAMIDFGPYFKIPFMLLFGAAAPRFGIFFVM